MKVNLFDLLEVYENEVKKNVRNKKIDMEKSKDFFYRSVIKFDL